jgi:hypothetical protein
VAATAGSGGDRGVEVRHDVQSLVSRLGAPLVAFFLTFAPMFAAMHAAEILCYECHDASQD